MLKAIYNVLLYVTAVTYDVQSIMLSEITSSFAVLNLRNKFFAKLEEERVFLFRKIRINSHLCE